MGSSESGNPHNNAFTSMMHHNTNPAVLISQELHDKFVEDAFVVIRNFLTEVTNATGGHFTPNVYRTGAPLLGDSLDSLTLNVWIAMGRHNSASVTLKMTFGRQVFDSHYTDADMSYSIIRKGQHATYRTFASHWEMFIGDKSVGGSAIDILNGFNLEGMVNTFRLAVANS